jgi:hypothetical protein
VHGAVDDGRALNGGSSPNDVLVRTLGDSRTMTHRRLIAAALAVLTVTALVAGCSSDDDTSSKKKSNPKATTTTLPTPPTVNDADFEKAAVAAEAIIKDAGTDECKVANAFTKFSAGVPTPANAKQTERAVALVASLFDAAAASAPPALAADATAIRNAAQSLKTEGAAKKWDPLWLTSTPGPTAMSDPAFQKAFQNYQGEVQKSCGSNSNATTTTTTP